MAGIDASIPLAALGQQHPIDPFSVAQSLSSMQVQRQNAAALEEQRRAIAESRQAATAKIAQENSDRNAAGEAIRRGGGVRDETLAWARLNAPNTVPQLTEFFDKSEKSAAELRQKRNELKAAQLDHIGHLADSILAHGATPEALQTGIALYAEQFPDEAPDVQKLAQQLQNATPDQVKGFLEQQRDAAPYYQAKQAKNTPQVVAPGGTLVDDTGKVLYSAPAKEQHSAAYTEWQDAKAAGYTGSFMQYQNEDANRRRPVVNVGNATDDDVKETVKGMMEGTIPPALPGRGSREYTKTTAEAHRQGYDLASAVTDWNATQKHVATMNGAQQLRLNQSVNALPELLDSVDALATKWASGKYPPLNKARLALAKNGAFGPQAASIANQLDSQIADVVADLGNVYMGGNSPTDHALDLAGKSLKSDWDEKVLHDMVGLAKSNVKIRQNSIRNTGVAGASANNPYAPGAGGDKPADLVYDPKTGKFTKPGGG